MIQNIKRFFIASAVLILTLLIPLTMSFGEDSFTEEPTEVSHLPRIVEYEQIINIKDPEISQAFYAELKGSPTKYEIHSDIDFLLYVNLLVPDLASNRTDFVAIGMKVSHDGSTEDIFILDGKDHYWEEFFEPFAGDNYLMGPEYEKEVPPGLYRIEISNSDNMGKYVLSIGKKEVFTFGEIINTIKVLPVLKKDFFEKSPLTAYFNIIGLFFLIPILLFLLIIFVIWFAIRKKRR